MTKEIKYDSTGKPYVILPSGRSRYISRKTEKILRKKQGENC